MNGKPDFSHYADPAAHQAEYEAQGGCLSALANLGIGAVILLVFWLVYTSPIGPVLFCALSPTGICHP